jgi:hypothetical protein
MRIRIIGEEGTQDAAQWEAEARAAGDFGWGWYLHVRDLAVGERVTLCTVAETACTVERVA